MLKFEGKFKKGDLIKAMDFESRTDCFILGFVEEEMNTEHGFHAYKVTIFDRVFGGEVDPEEKGDVAWIPHQVSFAEFDNRITLVERAENIAR